MINKHFFVKVKNQKGQALFEMIIFLPFLLFLYTIYYTIGNSINGSINQQKAVRSYFYQLVKGNSYMVTLSDLQSFSSKGLKKVGFSSVGWNERLGDGDIAFAPCFKFSSLLKSNSTEKCDDSDREEEGSSRFIRLFTYYGVCGPSYMETTELGGSNVYYDIPPNTQTQIGSCTLGNN